MGPWCENDRFAHSELVSVDCVVVGRTIAVVIIVPAVHEADLAP
jgi:hypothetical protein